jgi:RNA polymerase sigma-70 factor (ECF subfamily)
LPTTARADADAYGERTDEWLAERCRDSADEGAFAELARRYRDPVFRLALSILGQAFAPEAEDVTQEVLLRVHAGLEAFRGESKLGSWIYRIAFHRALSVKARTRFKAPHLNDDALGSKPSLEPGPHERLHDEQRQRAVLDCIAELPEAYQSALRLHYWLGAKMTEIAELLDTPENTVKSYLHRARRLLRALLAERGFDER